MPLAHPDFRPPARLRLDPPPYGHLVANRPQERSSAPAVTAPSNDHLWAWPAPSGAAKIEATEAAASAAADDEGGRTTANGCMHRQRLGITP